MVHSEGTAFGYVGKVGIFGCLLLGQFFLEVILGREEDVFKGEHEPVVILGHQQAGQLWVLHKNRSFVFDCEVQLSKVISHGLESKHH
jgi:hypothetical protein